MPARRLFLWIVPLLLVVAPTAAEAQQKFVASLTGGQEVPPNASTAKGSCIVELNAAETQVTTSCTYSGLGSALNGAHIHGPAAVGAIAGVVIDLAPPLGGMSGVIVAGPSAITAPQVASLRSNTLYINLHTALLPDGEIRGQLKRSTTVFDLDGDGRTDVNVFRQSSSTFWTQRSLDGGLTVDVFGMNTGENWLNFYPGEWDGDGLADYALVRVGADGTLIWSIFQSRTRTLRYVFWGNSSGAFLDSLAPADYDGDGILDIAVFRRSTGVWWILQSSTGTARVEHFGTTSDFPSVGDYDGDGKADLTAVRIVSGQRVWWTQRSSDGQVTVTAFGASATDGLFFFAPIDVDGDGKQDIMVNRTVSGQRQWIIRRSSDGVVVWLTWGLSTDTPLFGDYDGDGKTDFVARRDVGGSYLWYILLSSNGQVRYVYWGVTGDQ